DNMRTTCHAPAMSDTVVRAAAPHTWIPTTDAIVSDPGTKRRPPGTVVFWALVGVVGLVLLVTSWVPWLLSGHAAQPSPGPDHYRGMPVLRATEVLSMAVFLGLGWY